MDGVNSLDAKPYLPPITLMSFPANAATTSKYKGSPIEPGSLVLSIVTTLLTLAGRTALNLSTSNGL